MNDIEQYIKDLGFKFMEKEGKFFLLDLSELPKNIERSPREIWIEFFNEKMLIFKVRYKTVVAQSEITIADILRISDKIGISVIALLLSKLTREAYMIYHNGNSEKDKKYREDLFAQIGEIRSSKTEKVVITNPAKELQRFNKQSTYFIPNENIDFELFDLTNQQLLNEIALNS